MNQKRNIICLTPIKNEAWILDRFIQCASLWADYIIIADQNSDDDSAEIAKKYPKVIYVENNSRDFNEPERQKLLIDESRKIEGENIIIALDADEVLTGNFHDSAEWKTLLNAEKGTVLRFQWANLLPDMKHCWIPEADYPWGFVDDGSEHIGAKIHSFRVPTPHNAPSICLKQIKVMHYQYTDWERMQSKQRWYQAWERIHNNRTSTVSLFRQYNHMYNVQKNKHLKILPEWFDNYTLNGIDVTTVYKDGVYRWDADILNMLQEHGAVYFKKVPIWGVNWFEKAKEQGRDNLSSYEDPRSYFSHRYHYWLRETQANASSVKIRVVDEVLKLIGL